MKTAAAKILVVDDEPNIAEVVRLYLEHSGFETILQHSGRGVIDILQAEKPDLAVLDVMLPDVDGFELCRLIRSLPNALSELPILLLTAKGESIDKLKGFNLGADDYVVKPFDPNELVARVKSILRRSRIAREDAPNDSAERAKVLEFPDLIVDLEQYKVTVFGRKIDLTAKEIELLHFLSSNPNRVFTRDELLEQVWKFDFAGGTRTVDAHVKNLRKKIGSHDAWSIQTMWGIGYSFEVREPC